MSRGKRERRKHRPKKRQREEEEESEVVEPEPEERETTPPSTLPIFPLPVLPNAPSKTALALQGLDRGLLEAEIVDTAKTIPIDDLKRERVRSWESEDEGEEGELEHMLSDKMRKRLRDLGITELFAGPFVIQLFVYMYIYSSLQ